MTKENILNEIADGHTLWMWSCICHWPQHVKSTDSRPIIEVKLQPYGNSMCHWLQIFFHLRFFRIQYQLNVLRWNWSATTKWQEFVPYVCCGNSSLFMCSWSSFERKVWPCSFHYFKFPQLTTSTNHRFIAYLWRTIECIQVIGHSVSSMWWHATHEHTYSLEKVWT